ncbi:MAG: GIY-YIG nuclease family protein [Magnetospirillum sp. WYHS-4]
MVAVEDAEDLPALAGAYLLVFDLLGPVTVALPGRPAATLAEGRYLYAGSAHGSGGIRARVRRHLKGGKTVRWHVDRLTNAAGAAAVIGFPDGDECALAAYALSLPGAVVPAPGFGSSDCRRCPSHLIRVADDWDAETELAARAAVIWRRPPAVCFWLPPPGRRAP